MQFDGLAIMGLSHYTMLCKHGKRMRDFGGVFSFSLVIFYTIFGGVFNKTIIPFAFVGHEIGYSQLGPTASLAIYHLISNAHSWKNC